MKLQDKFVRNVKSACPKTGEKWLNELPELLKYCEYHWNLSIHAPFELSYNYVAPAVRKDGKEVVVKLGLPEDGHSDEREALQILNPEGIVQLIDEDPHRRILILEKVSPGTMLAELEDDEEATRIAADVIEQLTVPKPAGCRLYSTKSREENLRIIYQNSPNGLGPISNETLQEALQIFTYLNQSMSHLYVLHGDFHHYNILQRGGNWAAIDPKGLVGEVEYDLVQYLLNCMPPDAGELNIIRKRIDLFTDKLNLNKERFLMWGFAHTVLATSWSVNKQTEEYSESFYKGINIFQKLYYDNFHHSMAEKIKSL
ncbi:aminoglycoside phosphotransferase family protein [Halobacillus sp. Marseille-Q1614]|uniref:aminoglycoside phosphotransferase family protein n=1 Tax=Halobacillus sp. Marseille-Q1614 TaxID=2709134 RepID=UPI00156E64D7|nr:aminoglycoside phosphotransferase family protein [Halobacillus sp. Marseille-Q1614]